MAGAYTIFGKKVPAHILSIITLGSVAAGIAIPKFLPKDETKKEVAKPVAPIVQSKEDDFDLEKFINDLTKEESK
ncbi:hypothetical protein MEW_01679 [Candida albicans P60002]|nr:hypothetical protein MEO_01728 [Candida albicans P94015]KHC53422.1 hypothetical protein MEW_01679 [Candida albicans P60002]RLP63012.1 hypothetical protein L150_01717 [Candida albicans Ca529L]